MTPLHRPATTHNTSAKPSARSSASIGRHHPGGQPHLQHPGALPEIWSYGHRNPQGASMRPGSDDLWLTEHGPLGGDELNFVQPGRNYGWPLVSYGCPYSAGTNTPVCRLVAPGRCARRPTKSRPPPGCHHPRRPPASSSGGGKFTDVSWQGSAFTGGLAGSTLWRITLNGNAFVAKEEVTVVKSLGQRIRVVKQGPMAGFIATTDSASSCACGVDARHRAHATLTSRSSGQRASALDAQDDAVPGTRPAHGVGCALQAIRGGVLARQRCHVVGNQSH